MNIRPLIFAAFLPFTLSAQTAGNNSCYDDFRNRGLSFMDKKDYGEAISQFVAALVTCPQVPPGNDLSRLIEESKHKWANDLQAKVTEAQTAYHEAVAARNAAESAKAAEADARKKADENAERAYKRGKRAESFRLSLLADMARQQGLKTEALLLAWTGLQLADTLHPYLMRSFGEAVRDSFSRPIFTGKDKIYNIRYLAGGNQLLVQTAGPAFFLVGMGADAAFVQLPDKITHVAKSPVDPQFLAWGKEPVVWLFDATGKTIATFSGHTDGIRDARFSSDGERIVTCSRDNTARLWTRRGDLIAVLPGHKSNVQYGEFSPDGSLVQTRSSDGSVIIWNSAGLQTALLKDSSGHVVQSVFSGGNTLYTRWSNRVFRIYDVAGRLLYQLPQETNQSFATSSDRKYVAVLDIYRRLMVFDTKGSTVGTVNLAGPISNFAFSSDGKHIITWGKDSRIMLYDLEGKVNGFFNGNPRQEAISADYNLANRQLLSSSTDGSAKLWDGDGNIVCEWRHNLSCPPIFTWSGDQVIVTDDGGLVASIAPLPSRILAQMTPGQLTGNAVFDYVKKKYAIQYQEAIGK